MMNKSKWSFKQGSNPFKQYFDLATSCLHTLFYNKVLQQSFLEKALLFSLFYDDKVRGHDSSRLIYVFLKSTLFIFKSYTYKKCI